MSAHPVLDAEVVRDNRNDVEYSDSSREINSRSDIRKHHSRPRDIAQAFAAAEAFNATHWTD